MTLPADAGGPSEQPVRATPFWNGVIFGFADNFYMGALDDIDFAVRLEIPIVQFEKISDSGLLNDLHENGRNYYRMEIVGKIVRTGSDAEIFLRTVTLNGHALLNRHGENIEWFTVIGAEVEAQRKQRLAEAILNSLTDSVHVIPANRYLTINETETEVPTLTSNSYKSWLHNQSLSRSGFDTFKLVRKRLNEPPFSYGDISFVKDGHSIDIMVDDGCGYRMPVASKGTGVQQILVLLGYMSASRARVIGIEEPELNLSFKSQDDLITTLLELLRSETSNITQIFFTSHSDHVGSRGELQRIHVENPDGQGTIVRTFTAADRSALFPRSQKLQRKIKKPKTK